MTYRNDASHLDSPQKRNLTNIAPSNVNSHVIDKNRNLRTTPTVTESQNVYDSLMDES